MNPSSTSINKPLRTTSSIEMYPEMYNKSLFSNVPPCIDFASYNLRRKRKSLPLLKNELTWKASAITPIIVRKILANTGFTFVNSGNTWIGLWGKIMGPPSYCLRREYQKVNHIAGTVQIGRKDYLWINLKRMMYKFDQDEFDFIPLCYNLPQDAIAFKQAWDRGGFKNIWILKPPAAARGIGIKLVDNWSNIPIKTHIVVQKYIMNPYLINNSKFDLRIYVLVTNFNPLLVYIYEDGLVRFASSTYSDDKRTISDRYIHLTNYSINKRSCLYTPNDDSSACQGHKWTLQSLWKFLRRRKVNVSEIWEEIIDLIIKTLISGEEFVLKVQEKYNIYRYNNYELFGVDVLLDEKLKPWLLEINIIPSLHSASSLDVDVKGPMVQELLNIVGFHVPHQFDWRLYIASLSEKEKVKQSSITDLANVRDLYINMILSELMPDDVRHLIQAEDELERAKKFTRIFPTLKTQKYFKYFVQPRYYNMLLDAWEERYGMEIKTRKVGRKILEKCCSMLVHLRVPSHTFSRESALYEMQNKDDHVETAKFK